MRGLYAHAQSAASGKSSTRVFGDEVGYRHRQAPWGDPVALSRILNGSAGISAGMALKLADALGTSPELWTGMQTQYDLWRASKRRRKRISPFSVGVARHDTAVAPHSSQRT